MLIREDTDRRMQEVMRRNMVRIGVLAAAVLVVLSCVPAGAQAPESPPAPTAAPVESSTPAPAPAATPAASPASSPAPPVATTQPAAAPQPEQYTGPRLNLLIMPFDSQVEQQGNTLGPRVAKALKDASLLSRKYNGLSFNPRQAMIRRAIEESTIKDSDVAGPFGIEDEQIEKALKVARVMDTPRVMVGAITDFDYNSEKREGQITVTAEILNVDTGRVEGPAMIATGKSPANMVAGLPEQFALSATEDAVNQLTARFPGIPPVVPPDVVANGTGTENGTEPGAEPKKKKKNNSGILAALAIIAGILIAGGGGGGGGGGTSIDDPPAPPF